MSKLKNALENLELLESLEILDLYDDNGHTLLHSAAYVNSFKIVDYLISYFRIRLATYLK